MSFVEQADADFVRARRRVMVGRIVAWLRGRLCEDRLTPFEEARKASGANGRFHLGRRVVEVSRIVGSVGRHGDFDRGFMPVKASLGERWKRLDLALYRGEKLPPVKLYKLGDNYYVLDGNHRVSVARFQGVEMIEAEVTAFRPHPVTAPEPKPESDAPALTA